MNCDKKWMPLYAVTDRAWLGGKTLEEASEAALRGGATILQLREKDLPHDAFLREALALKALCARYDVPLIVNDDVDIALECGAFGVHIGQHDAPAAEVRRRIGPDMLLGVSAQTVDQAVRRSATARTIWAWEQCFPRARRMTQTTSGTRHWPRSARP